ncbi:MAG: alpha/beta hydrolase fold domain-containing protein [Actinobacteria bacterium]|nr:alpha/beta hydrolase fold domain-containing protein [Actinomycetota bacterium]MSX75928.1 alpha/beta hydrolase fold domain-containing protein [Actinomycetota bacterium]
MRNRLIPLRMPTWPRPHLFHLLALFAMVAATISGCGFIEDPDSPAPKLPLPPETNIAYGPDLGCTDVNGSPTGAPASDCGGAQQLDIYRSPQPGPNPVLLWFHGGGFVAGDKAGDVSAYLEAALNDGWDILAVDYRLTTSTGENEFPTAIQDAKRAVRWVKANAEEQDWDPNNVAAMGESAGGNIAAMLAASTNQAELEPTDLPAELSGSATAPIDSTVIASIALIPVTDLTLFAQNDVWGDLVNRYVGCSSDSKLCEAGYQLGSVQTHVTPQSRPLLSLHGINDPLAAPQQGVLLREAYSAAGIPERFRQVVVSDGPERYQGHEVDYKRFVGDFVEFFNAAKTT